MLKIILDANIIISGDKKHLLPLKHWKKTNIISPANFSIKKL